MRDDPIVVSFFVSFGVTGVALASVLALGRARKIRAHIAAVVAFLLCFLVTVAFAEMVGRRYRFDARVESIHLPLAIAGALSALGPVATGWRRFKERGSLAAHRAAIAVFLALFVGATTTGVWMMTTGAPR